MNKPSIGHYLQKIRPTTRQILIGDVLEQLERLPKNSIDCIVTSPPYWGIRDYGIEGQWGLEPDFKDYLFKLKLFMRGLRRVLKPTGSCWINLGDTYGGTTMHSDWSGVDDRFNSKNLKNQNFKSSLVKPKKKSRLGIPARFMIQCMDDVVRHPESGKVLDDYSWILRNDVPWEKPNAMPSSVPDRLTNRWEFVFFFVKEPHYYFNLDAIRVPLLHKKAKPFNVRIRDSNKDKFLEKATDDEIQKHNTKGERKMSKVPGQPTHGIHRNREEGRGDFESKKKQDNYLGPDGKPDPTKKGFNARWTESISKHYDENGNCLGCGKSWKKHTVKNRAKGSLDENLKRSGSIVWCNEKGKNPGDVLRISSKPFKHAHFATFPPQLPEFILKASCPKGGRVLDPFMGAGTTAKVCEQLGLKWIGIEIKKEYCDIALKYNLKDVEVQFV